MADYYDHHPTVLLERPVALIGFPGTEYREVGHDLASLTGLPLVDLDHWVEHQAGCSLWNLWREQGEQGLRRMEAQLLDRALRSRPCALIVLGDGALLHPLSLERVQQGAALVYFEMPLVTSFWELRRLLVESGRMAFPALPDPLEKMEQLRPFFEARRPGFHSAQLRVDMEGQRPEDVVPRLLEALPRLGGASLRELGDL